MRDLVYAIRQLRRSPLFTIAATLTLALAIGATASVFGLVDGVLLKAFPYRDADRVMTVWESNPSMQMPVAETSAADYLEFRSQARAFSALAAESYQEYAVTGGTTPERVIGGAVTPNYFAAVGITPVLGRPLSADSTGPAEVVIGYGLWQRRFGGSTAVLGSSLSLDNHPYTVVGVLPRGMPAPDELLTRINFAPSIAADRDSKDLFVYGRLAAGVTAEQAQRDLSLIAGRLAQAYPVTNSGWTVRLVPVVDRVVGSVRPALVMLLAAAGCVLLIGAANLANLFLVRCLARDREMAVRTALGASRARLVGEFLLEAGILCFGAGGIGVVLAAVGVRTLRAFAPPTLPRVAEIGLDGRMVAWCAVMTIASVLIVGAIPAWQASRTRLVDSLKQGGRGAAAAHRGTQHALVVLQVAVALVLLTGAGLLVESFAHFREIEPGFQPTGVLAARFLLPAGQYSTPERQVAFVNTLVDHLAAYPGVQGASVASNAPAGDQNDVLGFGIVGEPEPDPSRIPLAFVVATTPQYFGTMGIRLQRGRAILGTDDLRASRVAVVDEGLARQFFGSRNPIGQRIDFIGTPDSVTIVGVVASVRQGGLVERERPQIYLPFAQSPRASATLVVRVAGDPEAHVAELTRAVAQLDPGIPLDDVRTMGQRLAQTVDTTRFSTFLATLFAAVALLLGAVGIYSVLSYIVSQRRREIGVRIALGASAADVMSDVVRRALALTSIGLAIGASGAWMLTRVLAGVFVGVNPHDPAVFIGAAVVFGVVAAVAASIPAFRTTRVSPVVALTS